MGSGAVLGLAPAPEYTFIIFVSPVGNYFKVGRVFFKTHASTIFVRYLT
jgi:branched-chain amino acid aminotransferase